MPDEGVLIPQVPGQEQIHDVPINTVPIPIPRTIYDDRQNVHTSGINMSVRKNLQILLNDYLQDKDHIASFEVACIEIMNSFRKESIDIDKRKIVQNTLERIRLDKSKVPVDETQTISLQQVLIIVWNFIRKETNNEELMKRLYQELKDSEGMCSSGYVSRLVNSLVGFHPMIILEISFHDHLRIVLLRTIQDKIQTLDSSYRDELIETMIEPLPNSLFTRFLRHERHSLIHKIQQEMDMTIPISEMNDMICKIFPTLKNTYPFHSYWTSLYKRFQYTISQLWKK